VIVLGPAAVLAVIAAVAAERRSRGRRRARELELQAVDERRPADPPPDA